MTSAEISGLTPEQLKRSLPNGWTYNSSPNGKFIHIKDGRGAYRIRIDPPDRLTRYTHIHIFDSKGNSLDISGNIVSPNNPNAHIPR